MNGKAVFGPDKVSLNDCIARGPKLLNDLVEVLMKFRQQPIGLSCDIKEMFLNVYMPPQDWDWHRFFYTYPTMKPKKGYSAPKCINLETEVRPILVNSPSKSMPLISVAILTHGCHSHPGPLYSR